MVSVGLWKYPPHALEHSGEPLNDQVKAIFAHALNVLPEQIVGAVVFVDKIIVTVAHGSTYMTCDLIIGSKHW